MIILPSFGFHGIIKTFPYPFRIGMKISFFFQFFPERGAGPVGWVGGETPHQEPTGVRGDRAGRGLERGREKAPGSRGLINRFAY